MATWTIDNKAGEGDQWGSDAYTRSDTGTLIVDTQASDPIATLRTIVPPNTTHRHDNYLRASRYNVVERAGRLIWRMRIDYLPPTSVGVSGYGEWLTSIRFNGGTERMFQELSDPASPSIPGGIIGPYKYEPVANSGDATYRTHTNPPVFLKRVSTAAIPRGTDRIGGMSSMTMRTTTNHMSPLTYRKAADFKRGVNDADFIRDKKTGQMVFPAGTLLFASFDIDERIGTLPGTDETGFLYDITLDFFYHPEGHTPYKLTDTYQTDDGFEAVVLSMATNEPVKRQYRKYEPVSFASLIDTFGVSRIRTT